MPRLRPTSLAPILTALLCAGCRRELHSSECALSPASKQSHELATLTWVFLTICVIVWILVMLALLGAFLHRRRGDAMVPTNDPITEPELAGENRMWRTVWGALAITVVILIALTFADFATGRSLHKMTEAPPEAIRIEIVGHQWWWQVRYMDWPSKYGERKAYNIIESANEIHVPVGVPVDLRISSHDVIHSFWIPSLNGKRDLIPGHDTDQWITVDRPGTYYGECAEYCGYQHAQMRLVAVAESSDDFYEWLMAQRQQPTEPASETAKHGRDVFLHGSCAMCHQVVGTEAHSHVGPDLTHVASRKLLGAGAVENVPGHLAGWVIDPQKIKPGCRMPQNSLTPYDLRCLLEYLETLK